MLADGQPGSLGGLLLGRDRRVVVGHAGSVERGLLLNLRNLIGLRLSLGAQGFQPGIGGGIDGRLFLGQGLQAGIDGGLLLGQPSLHLGAALAQPDIHHGHELIQISQGLLGVVRGEDVVGQAADLVACQANDARAIAAQVGQPAGDAKLELARGRLQRLQLLGDVGDQL